MAVRTDFTAGEVLAAADLNDTFGAKVDYALPVNAQTGTTYTFVLADANKLTSASNAAAVTLTIPPQSSVTWAANSVIRVVNYGAGAVTVNGGSGVTVTNTATTLAQFQSAAAIRTAEDAWTLVPFAGGGVGNADFSDAATGTYTDGFNYKYITFNSSGTLTVTTAGFADILVVAGGSGGGRQYGGGGAGGHLEIANAYLPVATLTVTVGAGGSEGSFATTGTSKSGGPGSFSRLDKYYALGGGGGGAYSSGSTGQSVGFSGGSGGGGGGGTTANGGAGTAGQGNDGGSSLAFRGGGGGGAGAVGGNGISGQGGAGGAGLANSYTGTSVTRGGGGGGAENTAGGAGGSGGGGAGGRTASQTGVNGDANTGGGGGGSYASNEVAGNGGSGVVIVRVKV